MSRPLKAIASVAFTALALTGLTAIPAAAAPATHSIAEVQGSGDATPLSGTVVTVEGVVTGDYRNSTGSGYRGFYLQDPGGDPTDDRSDGIFIYSAGADPAVAIGDRITVTGTAGEYNGQTQVTATDPAAYEVLAADEGLPAATALPNSVVGSAREAYEGMLVSPESAVLSSSHQLYNYGTLWLNVGDELAVKATETTDAGEAAQAIAAANRANRLLVDDGYSIQISNAAHPGGQPYFTAELPVRNGDRFVSPVAGMILGYGFDDWRLQPQRPLSDASPAEYVALEPQWESANPRTDAPEEVGGDFSVGAFNVFNYFTTFGGDARGADTAEQFAIQQSKIVSAITALDADVVGLMEIENSVKLGEAPDEALANLVDALNAATAPGTWAYVPTPEPLLDASITDFITNAIIYQPAAATPVGESFTDIDETVWDIAREPVAQTFDIDGKVITVVANHFKSKSAPSGGGTEPTDLQGFFNAERVEQAQKLLGFVQGIAADPAKSPDVIALGDFNAYHEEDPSQVLTGAGLVDLVPDTTNEYTYTFDGELGSLDHAYVTPSLAESVTGTDVWTINSPEWSDRGYAYGAAEAGTPFRSSDHDPIKVGFGSEAAPVDIDLVSVNDFHGRIEASGVVAGAAVMAGMVDSYRAANPNTLFVGAGDFIGASTFTSFIQQDQPTIDVLNEMGLDASAFGNHEFDQGRDDVDSRILPAIDWDYLAANLYEKGTDTPAYQEYFVQEYGDVSVGFVGAVTDELPSLVSPAGIDTLDVGPVVPAVNRVADQLSDGDDSNGEADVVVLLVHEGAATADIASATDDSRFGQIVTGANANIDAIISGHTHLAYDHDVAIPGTDRTRPVLSSGQYGEKYSHTSLSVDPTTGELLSIEAEVLPLAGFTPDPEVAAIVAEATAVATELGSVPLGEITSDLNRGVQSTGSENRGAESTLGNFVADVQLWAAQDAGAQISFMNPGGLRADLKYAAKPTTPGDAEGVVTYAEAAGVQSFANTLFTLDLTGVQVKQVLEEQWQPAGASRPFLKLGVSENLEYTYDPAAAAGSHITGVFVDGEPIDPAASYKVVVNSFLVPGGDNFFTFAEGTNAADTGKVDLQSMVEYFEEFPTVSPDYAQRSVGVTLSAPDADGYSAGDSVTLGLSSLLMSVDGPRAGTVVVSAGDEELGTAVIDPAIVDTTDEVGRASVTITIPEGTPAGELVLTVTVPESGTTVEVPLAVTSTDLPIENLAPPVITGQPRVGATLKASAGSWNVDAPTLAYQWNRDGIPIEGATAARYTLVGADAGAAITVTVTASAEGYTDGVATSGEFEVRKAASSTSGDASRLLVIGGQSLGYSVTVRGSAGIVASGEVAIYDGSRKIATVQLDDRGRATVPITGLSRGIHLLTAHYLGNDQLAASVGWPSIVIKL
jgi:5'-nucleotidase